METIEILIFISVAMIFGGLVVGFLSGWEYYGMYDSFKEMMVDEDEVEFQQVDKVDFANQLYAFFEECATTGFKMDLRLYLKDEGNLDKEELFDIYKYLGWCETIQSADNGCGEREDIDMPELELPKIVRIECNGTALIIS